MKNPYKDWSKDQLIDELEKINFQKEMNTKRKKGFPFFLWKVFAGRNLNRSMFQFLQEIKNREIPKLETVSNLLTAVFKRFTRIGICTSMLESTRFL